MLIVDLIIMNILLTIQIRMIEIYIKLKPEIMIRLHLFLVMEISQIFHMVFIMFGLEYQAGMKIYI